MHALISTLRTAILLTIVLTILLCVVYPAAVWASGQALFPHQANGSLIVDTDGAIRGSELLGQVFSKPGYFHARPSAAGAGYDATASSGSNLGPTSEKLSNAIKANVAAYRAENGLPANALVPADAVTASASGLDPQISLANAELQAPRVARARNLPLEQIHALIEANNEDRDFGILGDPGVNVLKLNRALDALK
ncbi:MAG TPA: K(+)-transporting ATPase subunit C [Opitutaceae bacterium]|nr:K(+)-transporting ATPase subunit C [Opitutaceae bacterium]